MTQKKKQIILLQVIQPNSTQTYDITKSEFVLGRGTTSEVPINESGISREHVKVRLTESLIEIQDLNSSNGTFLEGIKLNPMEFVPVRENYSITFGNSSLKLKLKLIEVDDDIEDEIEEIEKESDHPPIEIDLSAFPKSEEDFKMSFKNVGLNMPKYKNPSEHAQEIIKEAEYIKHSIIKSAEVFKTKTINEAKIITRKATDEAYTEYQKLIDRLLDDTRKELIRLKTETEILLDDKRLQANDEIQNLWKEHQELIRKDKEKQLEVIEKENKIKLELSIEKMKSDMFSERLRLITDAENEILQKKRTYQVEFENEKSEHLTRIKLYSEELLKIQNNISECEAIYKECKTLKEDSELELSKILSQLKVEKENLEYVSESFKATLENHKKIEDELAQFAEMKQNSKLEQDKAQKNLEELSRIYTSLCQKKESIEEEINRLSETLEDAKAKAKAEVEAEYSNLKEIETKKFNDFKANEIKELQKIRDSHTNGIKKFSVDLSQEIATKIEMLAKQTGYASFNFEKNFELINSVIQVKSAINTGSESKHAQQLDDWKKRKRKENFNLISSGFAAGVAFIFIGSMVYKRLSTDPVQEELARLAVERKQHDAENAFVATKTDRYYDNYVEATVYTKDFADVYLNDQVQQEWVNYATKHFLSKWRVEEEKMIQVISNSRALVQNINEAVPTLKKDRLNTDIGKLKAMEQENIDNQAKVLGNIVKYEAYKRLEKEFFTQKLQRRVPANK